MDCFRLRSAVVVVIAIGAIAYVRYLNNNSYDYQISAMAALALMSFGDNVSAFL